MYEAIETAEILRTLQRHIHGIFIRDHRANGGYLDVMKGTKYLFDYSRWSEAGFPAVTLMNLLPGMTPRPHLYNGVKLIRPGYQQQFRKIRDELTPQQREGIERDLNRKVF